MEIKQLYEEMQRTFNELKAAVEAKVAPETVKKIQDGLDKVETKLADVMKMQERIDELETKLARPGFGSDPADAEEKALEQRQGKSFDAYLRKGAERLSADQRKDLELKDFSTDSDPDGGFFMPVNRRRRLLEKIVEFSPIRELATVETISIGDQLDLDKEGDDFEVGWVGERQARPSTASGTFKAASIRVHEQYAKPRATQKSLDDLAFDIEGWINRKLGVRFGVQEAEAFLKGDGVGKPEGILQNSAVPIVNSGDAALLTPDGVIKLFYALPEVYARNSTWLLKRLTIQAIRLFKDDNGQYLWQPGLQAGQPPTILGRPYREAPEMDDVGAGKYPILFGDFREGYTIVDRQGVRVLRDPYSAKPFIEFYTTRRVGGQVVRPEAFVKQKVAA